MAATRLPATRLPAAQADQPNCTAPGTATGYETDTKAGNRSIDPACDSTGYPACNSTIDPAIDPAIDTTIYAAFYTSVYTSVYTTGQQTGSRGSTPKHEAAGTQADAESGGKAFLSYGVRVKGQSKPTSE